MIPGSKGKLFREGVAENLKVLDILLKKKIKPCLEVRKIVMYRLHNDCIPLFTRTFGSSYT